MNTERDERPAHLRVFGAGRAAGRMDGFVQGLRVAGIDDPEGFMNAARLAQKAAGLNGTATKVLNAIPIAQFWTPQQISAELHRNGVPLDRSTVDGCLTAIHEAGLTRFRQGGYMRVTLEQAAPRLASVPATEAEPAEPPATQPPSPVDRLASLAGSLRTQAAQLTATAEAIEDAVLDWQSAEGENAKRAAKLEQLQSLLKELG